MKANIENHSSIGYSFRLISYKLSAPERGHETGMSILAEIITITKQSMLSANDLRKFKATYPTYISQSRKLLPTIGESDAR